MPHATMSIQGRSQAISDPSEAVPLLVGPDSPRDAEVWVTLEGGQSMAIFLGGPRAAVRYLASRDDLGQHATDPAWSTPEQFAFQLIDGQTTRFAGGETIERDHAAHVAKYFIETGEPAPWVEWHDDRLAA
jgi:hypothetical protein